MRVNKSPKSNRISNYVAIMVGRMIDKKHNSISEICTFQK